MGEASCGASPDQPRFATLSVLLANRSSIWSFIISVSHARIRVMVEFIGVSWQIPQLCYVGIGQNLG